MIKNIVFDIGQVLMGWHPQLDSVFEKETAEIVENAVFKSKWWPELDRGILSEDEIFKNMLSIAPEYEEQIKYVLSNIKLFCDKREYAASLIKDLKSKGYKVFFLSNYNNFVKRSAPDVLYFLPEMDGGIFSCDVKLIKPDHRIYNLLCEKYDLIPAECIFLDDTKVNVEAAIACGWSGILFENSKTTIDDLYSRLAIV